MSGIEKLLEEFADVPVEKMGERLRAFQLKMEEQRITDLRQKIEVLNRVRDALNDGEKYSIVEMVILYNAAFPIERGELRNIRFAHEFKKFMIENVDVHIASFTEEIRIFECNK